MNTLFSRLGKIMVGIMLAGVGGLVLVVLAAIVFLFVNLTLAIVGLLLAASLLAFAIYIGCGDNQLKDALEAIKAHV